MFLLRILQLLDLTLTSQRLRLSELLEIARTSLGDRLRVAVLSSPSYKRAREVQEQWIRFLTEWDLVWTINNDTEKGVMQEKTV